MKQADRGLLAYSRSANAQPRGCMRWQAGTAALRRAILNLKSAIRRGGRFGCPTKGFASLEADEVSLAQLFQKSSANALKFRRVGSPDRIFSRKRKEWNSPCAGDTASASSRQIFEAHRHGVSAPCHNKRVPARGIGLAICKKWWSATEAGSGWSRSSARETTFYFTMPKTKGGSNNDVERKGPMTPDGLEDNPATRA